MVPHLLIQIARRVESREYNIVSFLIGSWTLKLLKQGGPVLSLMETPTGALGDSPALKLIFR
jgi:hypothetical protein